MRKVLTSLSAAALIAIAAASAAAQTPPAPASKDISKEAPPPAATPPQPTAPPAADKQAPAAAAKPAPQTAGGKVETSARKPRTYRAKRRARSVRTHRHGWRNVWVYRAHDRHGYRRYEYVRRKFGGYFARARDDCRCRRAVHVHHHGSHRGMHGGYF